MPCAHGDLDKQDDQIFILRCTSIMGASGSGKTTLLNCISTIDRVSSGHIYLGEQDLTTISSAKMAAFRRENLGFIFQDFNLLEPLTIEENISLPLSIKGIPGSRNKGNCQTTYAATGH